MKTTQKSNSHPKARNRRSKPRCHLLVTPPSSMLTTTTMSKPRYHLLLTPPSFMLTTTTICMLTHPRYLPFKLQPPARQVWLHLRQQPLPSHRLAQRPQPRFPPLSSLHHLMIVNSQLFQPVQSTLPPPLPLLLSVLSLRSLPVRPSLNLQLLSLRLWLLSLLL